MQSPVVAAPGNSPDTESRKGKWRVRAAVAMSVVIVTAVVAPAAVTLSSSAAGATGQQLAGSVAAPSASEVSPMCDTVEPATVLGPTPTTLPTAPVSTVATPAGGAVGLTTTATDLYVVNAGNPATLDEYTLAGSFVTSFTLPAGFNVASEISQPVVDSSGNIYISSYYAQKIDKFSPTGTVLWSVDPSGDNPTNLFQAGAGASTQLVVSVVQGSSSMVLNESTGATGASFPFFLPIGGYVTDEPSGNFLASVNGYVETVGPGGAVLSTFGSSGTAGNGTHTGGPYQFYYSGQAVQGADGTVYTSDPLGTVEATSPTGLLQGKTSLGGALSFGSWGMQLVGGSFYFISGAPFDGGAAVVSTFSLTSLQAYLAAPAAAPDVLGWGAGLSTPATGEYFTPGVTPKVNANFDPWWVAESSQLSLAYSVENQTTMNEETVPTPTTIALPTTAAALASVPLTVPAQDTLPGPYEVQATLENDTTDPPTVLGTTCLPYAVGAGTDSLNLGSLPAGSGGGGPTDTRGVPLSQELGLNGLRSEQEADWSTLLPNCNFSAPTAATCGASAMDVATAPVAPYQAAAEAAADHVTYWYQVSGGGSTDMALVTAGLWGQDVQALVAHYATVPAGCGVCAPVTMWEPWNESNNTGWSSGATYTTSVLIPFYNAVKAVLPGNASTVLGGSTLEPDVAWWNQLIGAGGLSYMDVAAMHPYTGSDDSWEEDGMIAQIQQLQGVLAAKPLWFTEVGWWSDGDFNYLEQANIVARAEIWMKVLHIPVWGYFFTEGNWGNDGITFSLVQMGGSGDDYVKPAALASMESSQQLTGRTYTAQPTTGIPQTYQTDFGPTASGTTDLAAVWSDGLNTTAAVTLSGSGSTAPVTVTDQYGNATTSTVGLGTAYSLPITDQVAYVTYPAGDTLTLAAPQAYGANIALASAGANATATTQNTGNGNYAIDAILGLSPGYGRGWASSTGDVAPALTVTWPTATTVNRVVVDTQSVGSTAPGLRDYTVALDEGGTWTTVATETGQYRDHEQLFAFTPATATGVRVSVSEVNFGGYYGGGIPPWWASTSTAQALIHAVQVFPGTGTPAQVAGSGLVPITTGSTGPAPPTGLVAAAGNGQVGLTWNPVPGATSYTAYENGTSIGSVTPASDTVTGLTNGTAYSFTVSASDSGGSSAQSTAMVATPEPSAPASPTGLVVVAGDGQVGLTWSAVSGATSYTVYENGTPVGSVTSASDTVTGLTDGTAYSFTVSASNGGGTSGQSTAASATPEPGAPATPTGLVAVGGNDQVALTWNAVSGATSYSVFAAGVPVATTTTPAYTETGLTNGTTYPFAVEAVNGGGTSPASSDVSATPEPPPPATPIGLLASSGDGQVGLTWNPVPGATSYTAYENGTSIGSVTSASDTVTGLTNGTAYSFTVSASNGGGTSGQSSAVVATPVASTPAAPTGLTAAGVTADSATLTWTPSTGATGYTVYANGTAVATSTTSTAVVTDLQAGTPYSLHVNASGPGGTSVPGGAVPIVTTPGSPRLTVQNFVATLTFTGDTGAGGPSWTVLDNGVPMQGVTFVANGSTVRAVVRNLAQGTAYDFSVRGSIGGAVSPPTAPLGFLTRSIPTITTSGTVQTLTWGTATTGMSWKVEGCSSTTGMCTGVTPVTTGPMTQTGATVSTTVSGCSPTLYYRYRVVVTDMATHASRAGQLVSAGQG